MSMFLFKTLSIAIRTLARPLINYFSYYNRLKLQESNNKFVLRLKNSLIFLGQKFNFYNTYFNRKIFKLSSNTPIKSLSADKALERGAELISEFIVYSILLIVPTYEILKAQKSSKKKEEEKKQYLINMRKNVDELIELNYICLDEIKDLRFDIMNVNEKIFLV